MTWRLIFILFFLFPLSSLLFGQNDSYSLAMQAYEKKDYKNYLLHLQALEKSGVDHPALIHLFAGAYALNNNPEEALNQLNKLGEMGLYYPVDDNADFKSFLNSDHLKKYKAKYGHQNAIVNNSKPGFVIPEKDLIPEGIAHDPVGSKFYVGSLFKNKIVSVDSLGNVEDFKKPGEDGLFPVLGMKVDRGVLWVCSSAEAENTSTVGMSGVFKFDLKSKKLIKKYLVNKEGEKHFLNDLVIASSGDVYVTDSHFGSVYTIPAATDEIIEIALPAKFGYPNGITLSPDEKYLFVADFKGVRRIDFKDKSLHTIVTSAQISLYGLDGIYFVNNAIVAVQNGIEPQRIIKFDLNSDFTSVTKATILESNNPLFKIPTTGVMVKDYFYYITNSHLRNLEKGKIVSPEKLTKVSVLKVKY